MRLRYFLRLTVAKAYGAKAVHEETFRVYTTTPVDESESNNAIKMEARPRVARAPRTHLGSTCRRRSPWLAGRARAFISPQLQLDLEQVGIEDCLHIEFEYN